MSDSGMKEVISLLFLIIQTHIRCTKSNAFQIDIPNWCWKL